MSEKVRISRAFKDISLSFQPHPVTGDLPIIRNEEGNKQVRQEHRANASWRKVLLPLLALMCGLSCLNLLTLVTHPLARPNSRLLKLQPRIDNIVVEVEPRPDNNEFEVTVIYEIVGQDVPAVYDTFGATR